jgi:hypothetical protein
VGEGGLNLTAVKACRATTSTYCAVLNCHMWCCRCSKYGIALLCCLLIIMMRVWGVVL